MLSGLDTRLSRRNAIEKLSNINTKISERTVEKRRRLISELFGELTFGLGEMREKLPREAYNDLIRTLEKGERLKSETADAVAQVVKEWAVGMGATHFCHWFQPMTGSTAEKHDAFIGIQYSNHSELRVIERFSGGQLVQGEPDASSFPSGGMRTTFEARGYTAWDPTSPIFILEASGGNTLCIPSVFFGYHGQALDNKTPLLRSVEALSKNACEFLKKIGDVDVKKTSATLGAEQEYFLIDRTFAFSRPDIVMAGRTVLGAAPPRGQQMEDHYFGSIPSRVKAFMNDLEDQLYRLGIPVKTRHNEVAPSQFELAPIFEDANISSDHNALTMDTLKRVANEHNFICLLHEKPFADLNGNGKHCNWSISNDKGENLLDPGKTPHQNLRFLAILAIVMKAVYKRANVLRASIASPGNDHRLGGNEAPPAIISVFLGSTLSKVIENIGSGQAAEATEQAIINLGVSHLPTISVDNTDRNRTSPFAFTGNKFEFRAVGGMANVAVPMMVLNAAVAEGFEEATNELEELLKTHETRDQAIMALATKLFKESEAIHFEGNNYSEEWAKEAQRRGLPNLKTTPEALTALKDSSSIDFFIKQGVLTQEEITSRYNVSVERYTKTLLIELNTLFEMVTTQVIPAVESQIQSTYKVLGAIQSKTLLERQKTRMAELESIFEAILEGRELLVEVLEKVNHIEDEEKQMDIIVEKAIPIRDQLRAAADKAELMVSDEIWPFPKYREMLFLNSIS